MRNRWVLRGLAYMVCVFVGLPIAVVIASSFGRTDYVMFPPAGATLKWYQAALSDPYLVAALRVSVTIAASVALMASGLGFAVSFALDRYRFPGRNALNAVIMAPLATPTIVLAIGLVFFMTVVGLIATITGLILSHLVVTLPFAVRALSAALGGVDRDTERSAAILGAGPLTVLRRVTLPMIRPGVVASLMFCFLASFNNVTLSLFIAGPTTQTFPVRLFQVSQNSLSPVFFSAASLIVACTVLAMVLLEKRFSLYSALERGRFF
jgi:putative spermidine/putrescine transport system permease protein